MPSYIVDTCQFTTLGLMEYLSSHGFNKRKIKIVNGVDGVRDKVTKLPPRFVFISEDCFMHDANSIEEIKEIINTHLSTIFVIFITSHNIKFVDYFYIAKNVIVSSKCIKPETMNRFVEPYLKIRKKQIENYLPETKPIRLSLIESEILRMWMSALSTKHISLQTKIKPKTISSHKVNIKNKTRLHNKHIMYHYFRLSTVLIGSLCFHFD